MVPMAPSSTRMRSAARRRSACSAGERLKLVSDTCRLFHFRAQAKQVAYCVNQVGAVHGVEMKVGHTAVEKIKHLLGRDCRGNELAGGGVVVEPLEALGEPVRYRGAAARREIFCLLEILHRQDARHDRDKYAAGAHPVEIAEVEIVLEKKLSHCAGRAGIDLGLEH